MKTTNQNRISKMLLVTALAVAAASTSAFADNNGDTSLAIKFANNDFSSSALAGVTAVATQNWNIAAYSASGTFGTLNEDTGGTASASTVTGTWSSSALETSYLTPFGDARAFQSPSANAEMMYGGLGSYSTSDHATISLMNIGSEFTSNGYSLYIYTDYTGTNSRAGTFNVNGTPGTNLNTNPNSPPNAWIQSTSSSVSGDYVLVTGLTSSTLTITGTANTIADEIQGIELVANPGSSPEPATYAMLLGGLVALGFMVRRRQSSI